MPTPVTPLLSQTQEQKLRFLACVRSTCTAAITDSVVHSQLCDYVLKVVLCIEVMEHCRAGLRAQPFHCRVTGEP